MSRIAEIMREIRCGYLEAERIAKQEAQGSLVQAPGSEKCGNCGDPAAAWCIVSSGKERMPGYLCGRCIEKHKAEVVFPNEQGQARRENTNV